MNVTKRSLDAIAEDLRMILHGSGVSISLDVRHAAGCAAAYPSVWRRRLGHVPPCDCFDTNKRIVIRASDEPVRAAIVRVLE